MEFTPTSSASQPRRYPRRRGDRVILPALVGEWAVTIDRAGAWRPGETLRLLERGRR